MQSPRKDDPAHRWDSEDVPVRRAFKGPPGVRRCFHGAARGVRDQQREQGHDKSRNAGDVERNAPPVGSSQTSGDEGSKEAANRQSQHEERKRARPLSHREKVADEGIRSRRTACFSNADPEPRQEKGAVIPGHAGGRRQQAPKSHSERENFGAVPAIRQAAKGNANDGV